MYRELLADATFHHLLLASDADIADATRAARCELCRGVLHSARYPRKPRGRPKSLRAQPGPEHDQRFSFCCAIDGCRSRETPPSLRCLGRKVYLAAFVSPLDHARLPASLLERFGGGDSDRLIALLRFPGPVTGGRVHVR